jgi:hypothetical protein
MVAKDFFENKNFVKLIKMLKTKIAKIQQFNMSRKNIFEHKLVKKLIADIEKDNLKLNLRDESIKFYNETLNVLEKVISKDEAYILNILKKEYSDVFSFVHYRLKSFDTYIQYNIRDEEKKELGRNLSDYLIDYSFVFEEIMIYIVLKYFQNKTDEYFNELYHRKRAILCVDKDLESFHNIHMAALILYPEGFKEAFDKVFIKK